MAVSVKDWVGEFFPKRIRVIPLIEDIEHLFSCDSILEEYLAGRDLPGQRVFLARSDPALNYGIVAAELVLKVALVRIRDLESKISVPLFPIIGVGSGPFRGHLTPVNVDRALREYPSAHTFTVQSAFKYDYDSEAVRLGIEQLRAHEPQAPVPVDQSRAPRGYRQDHSRISSQSSGPAAGNSQRSGPCTQATRTETPCRAIRLWTFAWGLWGGYATPGHRICRLPIFHRRYLRNCWVSLL